LWTGHLTMQQVFYVTLQGSKTLRLQFYVSIDKKGENNKKDQENAFKLEIYFYTKYSYLVNAA
jgi:hypothetical protein